MGFLEAGCRNLDLVVVQGVPLAVGFGSVGCFGSVHSASASASSGRGIVFAIPF